MCGGGITPIIIITILFDRIKVYKKNQKGKKEKTNHHRHSFSSAKRERDMSIISEIRKEAKKMTIIIWARNVLFDDHRPYTQAQSLDIFYM